MTAPHGPPGPIESAGAPRDLGRAQGLCLRNALRKSFDALPFWTRFALRLRRTDSHTGRVARDMRRYFPHQAEALEGMSQAAHVPLAWLHRELAHQLATRPPHWTSGVAAVASRYEADRAPAPSYLAAQLSPELLLRRSRPEGCFRSIEVTMPWLTSPLAGVNEPGLAVVCVPGGWETGSCAAPAVLLAADCLARFGEIEGALDWCVGRPGGGRATLLFGDATGEVAGIEFSGSKRRVLRPVEGSIAISEGPGCENEIGKALREQPPRGLEELNAALGAGTTATPDAPCHLLVLDPADRRLGFREVATAAARWFPV